MLEKKGEFARKNAGKIVGIAVLLLIVLVGFVSMRGGSKKNASSTEARIAYLQDLGWEALAESEEYQSVTIPDCSEGAMADYNTLMKKGGFDLSEYQGKSVAQYRYELSNYPDCAQKVFAVLYVYKGRVIGGDIHTAALDGFMHELRAIKAQMDA